MLKTKYLYDVDVTEFQDMPYKEALVFKLKAAKTLFDELYLIPHFSERNESRVDAVYKALKFNRKLLAEIIPGYIA